MDTKPKFTENNKHACLYAIYAHKYDTSNMQPAWHIVVYLAPEEYATFNVKANGSEYPVSVVNDVCNKGGLLMECREAFVGSHDVILENSRQALAFIKAREAGYVGEPVVASNYDAKYLRDKWPVDDYHRTITDLKELLKKEAL